jgi:hypothetical protein
MKSISNQILDFLLQGLPYRGTNIGLKFNVNTFSISNTGNENRVNLNVSSADFTEINNIFTGNGENNFTISGIHLKNNIVSFTHFGLSLFTIRFALPHNLKNKDAITLEGFTNSQYNASYITTNIIDDFEVRVKNESVQQQSVISGLGYRSVEYIGGLNKIVELTENGSGGGVGTFYYTFDEEYFAPTTVSLIDFNKKPYIHYIYSNILCTSLEEFLAKNTQNGDNIIIDTQSLKLSPHRANSNTSDANYSGFGINSRFSNNAQLNIYVITDGTTNSSNDDAILQQFHRDFCFILSRSLEIEKGYTTTMRIAESQKDTEKSIENGRRIFQYNIQFTKHFTENSNVLQLQPILEKIETVQYNHDTVKIA